MVIDRQAGDDLPNGWICALVGNGSSKTGLFIGYLVGAAIMLIGGLFEVFLGVQAAGKSLGIGHQAVRLLRRKAPPRRLTLTASHALDAAGKGENIRKHFNLPDRLGPTLGNPAALASCTVAACHARYLAGWLGGLDDRGVQAGFGFVHADNADAGKADRLQQVAVLRLGKGAVGAADPLLGLGELAGVDAVVGGDIGDAQPPPGRRTRKASTRTRGLSADRLMTQLEMTTSTCPSGSGMSSMWPCRNLTLVTPA